MSNVAIKIIFGICFFLYFLNTVSALEISPMTQSIDVFTNSAKNFYVNITNNGNESIYFVTLSSANPDIYYVDNNFNLTVGEAKNVKLTLSTLTTYTLTSSVKAIYYKKVNVSLNPTTEQVSINSVGYQPQITTIVQGSTIVWTNADTLTHSVTSTLFDNDITPNNQFSYTFSNLGVYEYNDKFTNYNGQIVVLSTQGSDYAHNPLDDKNFTVDIKSKKVDTVLEISLIDTSNFTVRANAQVDSVLLIKNIGNKTAEDIRFSGEWLSFGKNNIYLAAGEYTYVTFTMSPSIASSDKTNITYEKSILVSSNNTLDISKNITIFVPYMSNVSADETFARMFNQSLSDDFMLALHNIICEAHPDYTYCKPIIKEIIIYKSPPLPYNYTQEDIHAMTRRQLEIYNNVERSNKDINELINSIKDDTILGKDTSLSSNQLVTDLLNKENENSEELKSIYYLIIIIFVLSGLLVFSALVYKYSKKYIDLKKNMET